MANNIVHCYHMISQYIFHQKLMSKKRGVNKTKVYLLLISTKQHDVVSLFLHGDKKAWQYTHNFIQYRHKFMLCVSFIFCNEINILLANVLNTNEQHIFIGCVICGPPALRQFKIKSRLPGLQLFQVVSTFSTHRDGDPQ